MSNESAQHISEPNESEQDFFETSRENVMINMFQIPDCICYNNIVKNSSVCVIVNNILGPQLS